MKSTKIKPWHETLRYDENGCRVCDNSGNQDGYIRVRGYRIGKEGLVMLHKAFKMWGYRFS